jgi:tetratricopeptide (TPR) repeat protein
LRLYATWALLASLCSTAFAQQQTAAAAQTQQPAATQTQPPAPKAAADPVNQASTADRRRAAKLYLEATKLYQKQQFEKALEDYQAAARLDSANETYRLATEVARGHAVTALLQTAAQQRSRGDISGARATLTHALQYDPANKAVLERLEQAGGFAVAADPAEPTRLATPALGGFEQIAPTAGVRNFHVRSNQRQVIQQVFRAWGIESTVDNSVRGNLVRLDLDNVTFEQAMRALEILTDSFYVPIDEHRVLVARDTRELRQQYMRNGVETLPLPGLSTNEMTDMANLAKNVFLINQAAVDPTAASITLRGPEKSLAAFNATYEDLMQGRSEVQVNVKVLQVAHTNARDTGLQPPQQITVFNVLAEAKTIIQQNQDLVNQIIASGLAGPTDYAKILAILIASGQVTNSVLTNGWVEFGGSCNLNSSGTGTCSPFAFGASPGPVTFHLNLNSSDSRELDDFSLRLQDGEEGTLKSGTRYPIQTSSYSNLGASIPNIPGLTGAGNSGALSNLLAQFSGSVPSIPQIQYEDLGLVLKARPRAMRSGDVALTVDLKISSLAGGAINGLPILANRAYSGVITLPADRSVVIASEVDQNESNAISGTPGFSEIPGMDNVTEKQTNKNYATLLIILTPRVVRNSHGLGHTPMYPVDPRYGAQ